MAHDEDFAHCAQLQLHVLDHLHDPLERLGMADLLRGEPSMAQCTTSHFKPLCSPLKRGLLT